MYRPHRSINGELKSLYLPTPLTLSVCVFVLFPTAWVLTLIVQVYGKRDEDFQWESEEKIELLWAAHHSKDHGIANGVAVSCKDCLPPCRRDSRGRAVYAVLMHRTETA